jgi:uncharacterized membrane protein
MSKGQRFMFLDVLRGIAVLWMIQVHITNQLIDPALRATDLFHALNISNGYVAPTFIFCAGAGLWIALSRKGRDYLALGAPLWDHLRRLSFILLWAYMLHLPFYSLERWLVATPEELAPGLQIDVLQTIVYTSVAVMALFLLLRTLRRVMWASALLAVCIMIGSAFVWTSQPMTWAPPVIGYLLGPPSPFPLLPWSGYLFAGFVVGGMFMEATNKRRIAQWMVVGGLILPFVIFTVRHLPFSSPYDAVWWSTSPGMHLFRICGTLLMLGGLYLIEGRLQTSRIGSMLQTIGNESLFMYVSHLLIVYGAMGNMLKTQLGLHHTGYVPIIIAWVIVTAPLLAIMWWWHGFKKRRPDTAHDLLAAEVLLLIVFFIVTPAGFSVMELAQKLIQ